MTEQAARSVNQQGQAFGFFHDEHNLKIGLAAWSEIFDAFRAKLDYTSTKDEGIALLHSKSSQYLPQALLPK